MDVDLPGPGSGQGSAAQAFFPVQNDAPSRAIASVSGTDNLIALFGLEPTYDRFVRPYEINNVEERKPMNGNVSAVTPVDNAARPRLAKDYGYMLSGLMGTHDYRRDAYLANLVANPEDPMPPSGLRRFDANTLRDCFTLQIGTFEGFEHSDWTRTDMPTQSMDQSKAARKEKRAKRKAEAASISGSASNTPFGTPAAKRRRTDI